jgi:hypothetical protein
MATSEDAIVLPEGWARSTSERSCPVEYENREGGYDE